MVAIPQETYPPHDTVPSLYDFVSEFRVLARTRDSLYRRHIVVELLSPGTEDEKEGQHAERRAARLKALGLNPDEI